MRKRFPQRLARLCLLCCLSGLINLAVSSRLQAQIITTVAGIGTPGYSGDGGAATAARIQGPYGVAVDATGTIYFADYSNHRIRKVTSNGIITTVAGTGVGGYNGDGVVATTASLYFPNAIAVDAAGNIFISDYLNNRIRKVSPNGMITTVAGTSAQGYSGDGGPATAAKLNSPSGITVDGAGNLFIGDYGNNRVRKVDGASGIITTVAGTGSRGYSGDGGAAIAAKIGAPQGLVVDAAGNLFFAEYLNHCIRRVDGSTGIITTVAGTGTQGYSGDGGPATTAQLRFPAGITVDDAGNLLIADRSNSCIRKVDTNGIITILVGTSTAGYKGDGGAATSAGLNRPWGIAVDASGNLFIGDSDNNRIRKVSGLAPLLSDNASLSGLSLNQSNIAFTANTTTYSTSVDNAVSTATVTATTAEAGATVKWGETTITSGTAFNVPLTVGNNVVTILVTAPDGTTQKTYTININRQAVALQSQTITFNLVGEKIYGDADFTVTASASSSLPLSFSSFNTGVATVSPNGTVHIVGVGTTTITASQPGGDGYTAAQPVKQILTVKPASLTITANNQCLALGNLLPNLTVSYQGFVNGQGPGSLLSPPALTVAANAVSVPGNYTITASGAVSPNYAIQYQSGTLTVVGATLSAGGALSPANPTVTLTAGGGTSYAFGGPGLVSQNGLSGTAVVNQAGTYSVIVTGPQGCTATAQVSVRTANLPIVTLSQNGPLTCTKTQVTLMANSPTEGVTLSFQGPNGPLASTGNLAFVSQPGTYTVTAANSDGSTSAFATVTSEQNLAAPTLSANGSTSVLQGAPSVILTAANCAGTIQWSGPTGNTTGSSITVPTTVLGQFTYSAACVVGGCTSPSASLTVQVSPAGPTTSNCLSFAALCSGNPQEVRTINFTAPSEGDYQLVLTYLAPEKAVTALVRIDGVARTLGLSRATTYQNQSLGTLHLTAGSHTFQLGAGAIGNYLCFNGLCLTPSGSSGATRCNFAVGVSSTATNISCGAPLSLTAVCNGNDCAGVSYQWSGGGLNGSGATVSLAASTGNGSYTYSVTASLPGCTNQTAQTTVVVSGCTPVTAPGSNNLCTSFAEVCSGNPSEVRTQSFVVASEGDYELLISYKAAERASTGIVVLDGASRTVGFALARSYGYQSLGTIHLTAGTHTLQLSAAAGGNFLCFNGLCLVGSGNNSNPDCNFSLTSSASGNAPSCGSSVTLTAGCAGAGCEGVSFYWQGPGVEGNSATVNFVVPSANGNYTYTATASKFGCASQTTYQTIGVSGCGPAAPTPSNPCTTFAEVCSGNPKEVRSQTVTVASEGDYELLISYKAPERAIQGNVFINSTTRTMDLARTATYQQQTAGTVHLTAGTHTLQLSVGAVGQYACFNGVCLKATSTLAPSRLQAGSEESAALQVVVLGNPLLGESVDLEVRGAQGRTLRLQLTDSQGRILSERHIPQARAVEHQRLESSAKGLLLLRVSAGSQSQTVKLVKP